MKTLLDEFRASFLHAAAYAGGELRVIVVEGFRAAEPEDITVAGHVIKETYAIDASDGSSLVEVRFNKPLAWQAVGQQ